MKNELEGRKPDWIDLDTNEVAIPSPPRTKMSGIGGFISREFILFVICTHTKIFPGTAGNVQRYLFRNSDKTWTLGMMFVSSSRYGVTEYSE